ncbi:MAG: STAS domain-containing protein [bacterium]
MFKVEIISADELKLSGRFSAANVHEAEPIFSQLTKTTVVDFKELDYISSGGLSVLLKAQKKLKESGNELKLKNMNKMVRELFHYVGFDTLFTIE